MMRKAVVDRCGRLCGARPLADHQGLRNTRIAMRLLKTESVRDAFDKDPTISFSNGKHHRANRATGRKRDLQETLPHFG